MISTCHLISKYSSPLTNLLGTVRIVPTTTGITVKFMFHGLFSPLKRSRYSLLIALSLILFCGQPGRQSPLYSIFSPFLLIITKYGRLAEIRGSVHIFKSQKSLYVPFPGMKSGLNIYHRFVWSNQNFWHKISFSPQFYQVFYMFCHHLTTFAYLMIDRLDSMTTYIYYFVALFSVFALI